MSSELLIGKETRTGGRAATEGVILGKCALSVGMPPVRPPSGWYWTPLSTVARLESGHTPSRKHSEYWGGDIPWVGIRDATANHGQTIHDTQQRTNPLGIANSSARVLPTNTVCLSRTASVGYVVVMGRPMATSQDFINWVCTDAIDYRFLKYVFLVEHDSMLRFASGTTHQTIYFPEAKAFHICLPSIKTQRSIVEVLQSLDDRITLLRETNATLEAIAQALFKSWFVDFDPVHAKMEGRAPEGMDEATAALFSDSFEEAELGLVPKGWRIGTIGDFADVIDCLHAKKPELRLTGRPFLQLNNIRDDGLLDTSKLSFVSDIDYNKWISRIEVSEGDCVITNVGRVGAVAQIPDSFRAAMGRNMTAIRMKADWPYPTFLVELLQSPVMRSEIDRRTDIGTILNALNVRNIPLLRCVLPPKAVMLEFEGVCRPLRAAMEANLDRANSLATLRDTLLPRLISGQLRLPEASSVS